MGLFSLFSNDDAEKAAAQKKAGLQQGYDALSSSYGQGRDALTTNYGNASSMWDSLMGSSTANANAFGKAYGDATGANGVGGLQSAMDTFRNSGQYGNYGFSLDQGLQALNRTHAAAGNLASGNADIDAMKYATGLANQTYKDYTTGLLGGLTPYLGQQTLATSGAAGTRTALGNALNTSFQGQGAAANTNYTGQGSADAAATMNNYNVGQNILGAIGQGVGLFGGLGGFGALGNLAGGLFGSFTGGADGGTAANPLPGLSREDYGDDAGLFARFGVA